MATPDEVATAVAALLNDAPALTFGLAFTAETSDVPEFDLKGLDSLRVVVVPKTDEEFVATRGSTNTDISVDIGIVQKFDDADELADLKALREAVKSYVRFKPLTSINGAWLRTVNDPIFDPTQYRQNRVFLSVVNVTYRVT